MSLFLDRLLATFGDVLPAAAAAGSCGGCGGGPLCAFCRRRMASGVSAAPRASPAPEGPPLVLPGSVCKAARPPSPSPPAAPEPVLAACSMATAAAISSSWMAGGSASLPSLLRIFSSADSWGPMEQ